jgi:aconitate hydratase
VLDGLRHAIGSAGTEITVRNTTRDQLYSARHRLSDRQIAMLLAGGLIPWLRQRKGSQRPEPFASREAR